MSKGAAHAGAVAEERAGGAGGEGHAPDIRNVKGVGSVKAILIDTADRRPDGGVSPTGDSYVMAW